MVDNFIFKQDISKKEIEDTYINATTINYTVIGLQDYLDNDSHPIIESDIEKKSFAKKVTTNNADSFYIKIVTYGKIFNPIGMFSEGKNTQFLSRAGKNEYQFKKVKKEIFDLYLNFLSTKNLAWLNNAERGMM